MGCWNVFEIERMAPLWMSYCHHFAQAIGGMVCLQSFMGNCIAFLEWIFVISWT